MQTQQEYSLAIHRGKFCATWKDERGERHRHSLGTSNKIAAEGALIDFRSAMAKASAPDTVTVGHIVERYLQEHVVVSTRSMREAWERFASHKFAHLRPNQISDAMCKEYAAGRFTKAITKKDGTVTRAPRPCAAETVIKELGVMRNAFGWAYGKNGRGGVSELKEHVSGVRVWTPQPGDPKDIRLTREQISTIFAQPMPRHARVFLALAFVTLSRHSAILQLKWSQVDLENRVVDFRTDKGDEFARRRKGRAVSGVNDMLWNVLVKAKAEATSEYVVEYNGGPVQSCKKAVGFIARRTGIKFTPHVLRHTGATWLAEDGIDLAAVGQMLAHKSIQTTYRIYARYTPAYKARAAAVLNVLRIDP